MSNDRRERIDKKTSEIPPALKEMMEAGEVTNVIRLDRKGPVHVFRSS